MNDALVVLVTCGKKAEAERIAESLILEKLAACVNITPSVTSFYFWGGKLCNASEVLLIIKTTRATYKKLERRLKAMHSYDTPEIIAIPITEGHPAYLKWIKDSTSPERR